MHALNGDISLVVKIKKNFIEIWYRNRGKKKIFLFNDNSTTIKNHISLCYKSIYRNDSNKERCTFVTAVSVFSIVLYLQSTSWSFWLRFFLIESIPILTWTRLLLGEIDSKRRCGGAELVLLDFCSIFWFSTVFFIGGFLSFIELKFLEDEDLSIVESSLFSMILLDDTCTSFVDEIFLQVESDRSISLGVIVLSSCKLSLFSITVFICAVLLSTQFDLSTTAIFSIPSFSFVIESYEELFSLGVFFSSAVSFSLFPIVCFKKFFSTIVTRLSIDDFWNEFFSELHLISDLIGSRKARLVPLWKLARFCLADEKSSLEVFAIAKVEFSILIDGNDVDVTRWFEQSEACFFLIETYSSTLEFLDICLNKENWN